jgi:hypothetical protein
MGLIDRLQALGQHLKLIEMTPSKEKAPRKISTRIISLQDLTREVHGEKKTVRDDWPPELSLSFEQVFAAAGVETNTDTWTIERLRQWLLAEPHRTTDRPAAQQALLELLAAEKVPVEQLLKDAMMRDQALDIFEKKVCEKMTERAAARQKTKTEIEAQIAECKREAALLENAAQNDEKQLQDWRQRKEAYEKELTWAVDFLMERRQKERPQIGGDK